MESTSWKASDHRMLNLCCSGRHASQSSSPYGNTGFFGPWNLCNNIAAGYGKDCNPRIANYTVEGKNISKYFFLTKELHLNTTSALIIYKFFNNLKLIDHKMYT